MDNGGKLFVSYISIFPFTIAIILFVLGFHFLKKRSRVKNTQTISVSKALSTGYADSDETIGLYGSVETGSPLLSPVTKTPCVYYELYVERYESKDDDGWEWNTVYRLKDHVPFILRDSSGSIGVNPKRAEFVPRNNNQQPERRPGP